MKYEVGHTYVYRWHNSGSYTYYHLLVVEIPDKHIIKYKIKWVSDQKEYYDSDEVNSLPVDAFDNNILGEVPTDTKSKIEFAILHSQSITKDLL